MAGISESKVDIGDQSEDGAVFQLSDGVDFTKKITIVTDADALGSAKGLLAFGSDGSNIKPLLTNAGGRLQVDIVSGSSSGEQYVDGATDNGTEKGNVALGSDGTNFKYLLTDASGKLQVDIIGGGGTSGQLVEDGEIVAGAGTDVGRIMAGTDGSNYYHLAVDTTGQLQVDIISSALPTGGSTLLEQQGQSTKLLAIQTAVEIMDDWDESDRAKVNPVVGQAGLAAGTGVDIVNALRVSLATDIPLPVGDNVIGRIKITDGTDMVDIETINASKNLNVAVKESVYPTFVATAVGVSTGASKHMVSLVNTSAGQIIKIKEIWLVNKRNFATAGQIALFDLRRITSHSGGTAITPQSFDLNDTLAGVTVLTNNAVGGLGATYLRRWEWSTDEWGASTLDAESNEHATQLTSPMWQTPRYSKDLTLRQNQGITIQCPAGTTTTGFFDLQIIFTVEA